MTPSAVTPAGRAQKPRPRPDGGAAAGTTKPAGSRAAGHRQKITHPTGPRIPRRVSGPVAGRDRRRQPGRGPRVAPAARNTGALPSLGLRTLHFLRSLPDHTLLDRVVRGRAWIPILGVMLAGIVAMQVQVLKLGASMGRSIQRSAALQSHNDLLRASVASLSDDQRIERLAAGMGMVMPTPDAVGFLSAQPDGNVQQALTNIHSPDPAAFAATLTTSVASPGAGASLTSAAAPATTSPASASAAPVTTSPSGASAAGQTSSVVIAGVPASSQSGGAVSPGGG